MMLTPPLQRRLRALGLALLLGALGQAAPAEERFNPCDYTGFDSPCAVPGGEYRALKPPGKGPFPTVVYLHGSLGEADEISARRYFQRTVIARGYVLLVPRALDVVRYKSGRGTGWSHAARTDHPRDDIGFLARVLDHAEARFRIDRRRVVFAGQSDGGFLIWEIACHRPGLAAAYAVHAASYGGPLPERCAAPMRFLQAHGRRDRVVPFERARWRYGRLSAANPVEGLALLARANRCSGSKGKPVAPFHGFRRISWQGCARGAALDYLVHDGGHSYPWQWMPAVLDWFEGFDLSPPAVGQRTVRRAGERSGAFKAVPGRGAD